MGLTTEMTPQSSQDDGPPYVLMFVGAVLLVPTFIWLSSASPRAAAILAFKLVVIAVAAIAYITWKKRSRIKAAARDGSLNAAAYALKAKRATGAKISTIKQQIEDRADKL